MEYKIIKPKKQIAEEVAIATIQDISDLIVREFNEKTVEFLAGLICGGRLCFSEDKGIRFKLIEPINDKEYLTLNRIKEKDLKEKNIDPLALKDSETPAVEITKIVQATTRLKDDEYGELSFDETSTIFQLAAIFFL